MAARPVIEFYKPTLRKKELLAVLETMVAERLSRGPALKEAGKELRKAGLGEPFILSSAFDAVKLFLSVIGNSASKPFLLTDPFSRPEVVSYFKDAGLEIYCVDIDEQGEPHFPSLETPEGIPVGFFSHFGGMERNLAGFSNFGAKYERKILIEDRTDLFLSPEEIREHEFYPLPDIEEHVVFISFEEYSPVTAARGAALFARKAWRKHFSERQGEYATIPEILASLLIEQVKNARKNYFQRYKISREYNRLIQREESGSDGIRALSQDSTVRLSRFTYPVSTDGRAVEFRNMLEENGIGSKTLPLIDEAFPVARKLAGDLLLLPLYPTLLPAELKRISLFVRNL